MANTGDRRTRIQIEDLKNKILRMEIEGKHRNEICKVLGMAVRTYEHYKSIIEAEIVAEQTAKRKEDILVQKEVCKARLLKALRGEQEIAEGQSTSPRVKMDAWYRYGELAVAEFKLEAETDNWLAQYKSLNLKEPIPLSEIQEDEAERSEAVESDSNNDQL